LTQKIAAATAAGTKQNNEGLVVACIQQHATDEAQPCEVLLAAILALMAYATMHCPAV